MQRVQAAARGLPKPLAIFLATSLAAGGAVAARRCFAARI